MNVYKSIEALPAFTKAVVTIGSFDGVHLGHQQIIEQLKKEAARIGGESVLITFDPHPRKVVSEKPLQLLNTPTERIALLQGQGIDNLVIVPFTAAFSGQSAKQYIEDFLISKFHPHTVIIGYDHKFGKDRSGDFHLLETYAKEGVFELIEIPVHVINEASISSTKIRTALLNGQVEEARHFLGYDYFFDGVVVKGNQLGRTLGYPTANIQLVNDDKLIPGNGVYAVTVEVVNELKEESQKEPSFYKGMMNIGVRPTIDGIHRVIEVNIFDFNRDIYGEAVKVYLKKYLRGEQKFNGLEALKEQLAKDKMNAVHYLQSL